MEQVISQVVSFKQKTEVNEALKELDFEKHGCPDCRHVMNTSTDLYQLRDLFQDFVLNISAESSALLVEECSKTGGNKFLPMLKKCMGKLDDKDFKYDGKVVYDYINQHEHKWLKNCHVASKLVADFMRYKPRCESVKLLMKEHPKLIKLLPFLMEDKEYYVFLMGSGESFTGGKEVFDYKNMDKVFDGYVDWILKNKDNVTLQMGFDEYLASDKISVSTVVGNDCVITVKCGLPATLYCSSYFTETEGRGNCYPKHEGGLYDFSEVYKKLKELVKGARVYLIMKEYYKICECEKANVKKVLALYRGEDVKEMEWRLEDVEKSRKRKAAEEIEVDGVKYIKAE